MELGSTKSSILLLREEQVKSKEEKLEKEDSTQTQYSKAGTILITIGCISIIPMIYIIGKTVKHLAENGWLDF